MKQKKKKSKNKKRLKQNNKEGQITKHVSVNAKSKAYSWITRLENINVNRNS